MSAPEFNESGSKYLRKMACTIGEYVDVYALIDCFDVRCPARQHAIKKLLCSGLRGKGDVLQDLSEARDAITRAIQMEESRQAAAKGAVTKRSWGPLTVEQMAVSDPDWEETKPDGLDN